MYPMPAAAYATLTTPVTGLFLRDAEGNYQPATRRDVLDAAQDIINAMYTPGQALNSPKEVTNYLTVHYADKPHELFTLILLDSQHRLISITDLFRGTINGCSVYARDVVATVIAVHASAVIFAHNHPSGTPEPSAADRVLTERLKSALALIDVRVLDHLVIGGTRTVSFAERGWL